MELAFLGLGTMGFPMAGHLANAGHTLRVYNRSPAAAQAWCASHGGTPARSPAEAAEGAHRVFACVSDDQAVRSLALGEQGAFASMAPGAVFIDHSTGSAALARELAQAARSRGIRCLDAPVTGGKPGATQGTLTLMVGGEAEVLDEVRPELACYAKSIFHVGEAGAGQIAKMANQMCIGGILQSLAEALGLVERSGLDGARVLEVLLQGSGRSWQMEQRGAHMLAGRYDFGFAVEWLAKDLGICRAQAASVGMALPGTAVVARSLARLMEEGSRSEDVAALMRLARA